ncbi:transmembrane sensor [Rhodopseudomonas rhenobacensis]|uniref:Transmembrane sensor n=1 Tax=Rhodopseudomonas rhenobacensis TaxID=87461 RepID=A0A7W7Z0R7_9BRAD|nr:FecR domain-containing protein [Rhodopseudomonas rhenobacensis]MBB5045895.1 transmembrane sensor [Rhodopseudomonas rhenobacensis]
MSKAHSDLDQVQREAVTWVRKLISKDMAPEDAAALKLWCARSPQHEAAFVETKHVWSKVGAAGRATFEPDEDFLSDLDAFGQRRRTMSRRMVLSGGATVLAGASVYGVLNPPFGLWPSLSELNADYRTSTGEQRNVTFAGDVAIGLNTQTSLAVRPAEVGVDRIELIAGEASFATSARAARSLVVLAANGRTIAESGRFDVRYTASGEHSPVSVTCFEGVVQIERGAEVAELRAGQRVRYDLAGLTQIAAIDPHLASEWQRGIVEFRDTPIVEAIEEINRYRPGRIILMNAALSQKQLSGRFRIDQMNQVLLQLERAFSAKLQRLPGGIVILS